MPNELSSLKLQEISLVDSPANQSEDENGVRRKHAVVALYKRDEAQEVIQSEGFESFTKEEQDEFEKAITGRTQGGVTYPASDYAYVPDKDHPTTWKLRLTKTPGGKPDAGIVGAAIAALGKGFRGKKVVIPSVDLPAVKARVKSAWKQANPDKSDEDLPPILKGETNMTLQELEVAVKKQSEDIKKQEGVLVNLVAENKVLKDDNAVMKTERELVLKMSKKERKAYATMSPAMQKEFMAGDEAKRKTMCDASMKSMKEKSAEDAMDEACKAEYAKAGPAEKAIMIGKQLEKMAKAESDSEGGSNEDEMKRKKKAAKAKPEDDDDDDEDEDAKLQLHKRQEDARLMDRVVKAESRLEEITKKEQLEHFTHIAEKRLPNTSGSPVEKGSRLMQIAKLSGGEDSDIYKSYLADLENADKAQLIHFGEVGKAGSGVIPAEKVFMAKCEEIAKRDKINVGKAVEVAMAENPELYIAYEQDHRRATRM